MVILYNSEQIKVKIFLSDMHIIRSLNMLF